MKKKTSKIRAPRKNLHAMAHEEINNKLGYILNEVSANGNPGLDASLKDLHKGQIDIKTVQLEMLSKVNAVYALAKPDLDRAAFYKQAMALWKQSWLYRAFDTKLKATVSTFILLLMIQVIVHPFIETTLSVAAIVMWVEKIMGKF